jgi:hypothetical protein
VYQKIKQKLVHLVTGMGRPAASEENRKLAVAMALTVTRRSISSHDTIARCGKCSIFALFKLLSPGNVRDSNSGPRDGISEVEFNKALQVEKLRII